jgi:dimethylglycine catabolism B
MTEGRRLTVLDERRAALETCGYCPKLCRTSCPVSEVEGSEALIPWGKMTMTWYAARGDIAADRDVAALPWACTGCLACREHCAHENPVAPTLVAARAVYHGQRLAPAGSEAVLARDVARRERLRRRARGLGGSTPGAPTALLIGCGYLGTRGSEAQDAVRAARGLFGSVDVLHGCCGLAAKEAGDPARASELGGSLLRDLAGRELVVADAGCAAQLRDAGAVTLAEAAAARLSRLGRVQRLEGTVRWHDPCRLARGLGVIDEPRAVLGRALGAPPAEFERRGLLGACSGAGGLLPFTMPKTARAIARERLLEHERLGGGTLVTGCATSLGWLRAQRAPVVDLASVIAWSLEGG